MRTASCGGKGPDARNEAKRAVRQVLHHIIGRLAVPAHIDQPYDVARGVQNGQLLDFTVQERPVEPSMMGIKLDRNLLTGVLLVGQPDRSVSPVAERANQRVARHTGRRRFELSTQFRRASDLSLILNQRGIGIHDRLVLTDLRTYMLVMLLSARVKHSRSG